MVALASVRTAFADTDQSVLFGSPLPEQTGLYGVLQPTGSYVVYALRGDQAWPPAEEGERWPAYIARVNQVQSMPSGLWLSSVILDDMRANEIADQVNVLAGEVSFRHQVSWGYFDNGTTSVLAILWVGEIARVVPDGFVVDNDEDLVARSFHAVAYPLSEGDASNQFLDFFLPQIVEDGSGGGGSMCTETTKGGGRAPRMVEHFCRNDHLHRNPPTRDGGSSKHLDRDRATAMSGGENAAGFACSIAHTNCGTACDTTYVAGLTTCNSAMWTCITGAAGCALLGALPVAGFVCAAAEVAFCGTDNYTCCEVNRDVRTVCKTTCRTTYAVCCAAPGTACAR